MRCVNDNIEKMKYIANGYVSMSLLRSICTENNIVNTLFEHIIRNKMISEKENFFLHPIVLWYFQVALIGIAVANTSETIKLMFSRRFRKTCGSHE